MERTILHCDMNNFFASVECLKFPHLRDVPMAVCGDVEERHGVVLAKNEKAKAFGVSTGESVWNAKQKCPELVTVPPHHGEYAEFSKRAFEIYSRFTDEIEPFGMDECWLDVTGSLRLFGSGEEIADKIRAIIKEELGLTASVGVSFNKVFAKLGSDMKKPDATTVISKENFKERVWGLPATEMLGVGRATAKKLNSYGIYTIGHIAARPREYFENLLGKMGVQIWRSACGLDDSPVVYHTPDELDKSCGHGTTTRHDLTSPGEVWRLMLELSQQIGHKLYKHEKKAMGVSISIRDNRLVTKQWQCKLKTPSASPSVIAKEAFSLFERSYLWAHPIRSVTVTAIDLIDRDTPQQLEMFCDAQSDAKAEALDRAIEEIRSKYGKNSIKNAVLIEGRNKEKQ
ncbi:MAG: DNA polymerase IV [Ruminococcaceae bacterium]|nr:DNA polymerase IV [Oscillospiraceae bacterium]